MNKVWSGIIFITIFGGLYLSILNKLQIVASLIVILLIIAASSKLMEVSKKEKKENDLKETEDLGDQRSI